MNSRNVRIALCASTALSFAAALASPRLAQAQNVQALNLGSVVSTGDNGTGVAPSATGTLKQAQQLKKLAPNIISVQPQSQIQKLPDVNLAEALQRVPGVEMESDTGEGRFINIRGMDADLNGTTYDGVHLTASNQSTPSGGGRAVAMDAFPTGLVGGLEVVKSLTPDMDAEGLGGSVNLLPLTPPTDGNFIANINAAAGEETLRHTGIYQGSVTLGKSFNIPGMKSFANANPFAILFNYTNETDRRGIDDVEEDYNSPTIGNQPASLQDLQLRWYQAHRVRQGYAGELDFDPDSTTHFYIRALSGGYDEQIQKNRLELDGLDGSNGSLTDNGDGSYTATGATASKDFTNSNERIGYNLIAFGGKDVIGDVLTADIRGSWVEGYDDTLRSYSTTFNSIDAYTINYTTSDAKLRTYNATDSGTGAGVDLSNPALFTLDKSSDTPSRSQDQEFAVASDGAFATNLFGTVGEAKFGGEIRLREEGTFQTEADYSPAQSPTLAQLDGGNPNVNYYGGNYSIGPNVAYNQLFPALGAPTANVDTTLGSFAHNSENVYAAYAQETTQAGPIEILAGARVEITNAAYRGYANVTDAPTPFPAGTIQTSDAVFEPNTNKQDYINVFPAVQMKCSVNDQLQFRAAWSTAIARPGFQQISAAETVDYSTTPTTVTAGNPNLKPTTGNSFDITAEYYTGHDGLLSADAFYKLFDNYIASTTNLNGIFQGQPAQIQSFENISGAFARGIELDAQQKFYFLPGLLSGLGTDDNITFVDSRGRYDTDGNGNFLKANELPETSPLSYNAAIFYEEGPLSFRTAASYVSRNLFSVVAGGRSVDQFSQPRFRLDMSLSYQVTPQVELYADAKNLTNTRLEFTQSASLAYPIQREYYEQDFLFGVRLKLGS